MRFLTITLASVVSATPALAAGDKPFFNLANTDFIVTIAFVVFIGILLFFKVPGMLAGMLDKRAEGIRDELDEAKALREEAQTILASYERKQAEVAEQAEAIVKTAREDAEAAAAQAKTDLEASIARRLAAAEEQIASAEAAAVKQVKDRAVTVAVSAARDVIRSSLTDRDRNALAGDAIKEVQARLN